MLASDIAADTGWTLGWVTAAFSASQLVAALVGVPVGPHLDRHGPRTLMTAGSALAVVAVVGIATAPGFGWFLTAWMIAGAAMGAVLYPPAMAALTRWYGPERIRALTALTLVAGLASTVFAPVTAALNTQLDWRHTYLVLAAGLAAVTDPAAIARGRPFVALVVAVAVTGLAAGAVVVNLVPLLTRRGISPGTAAVVLGLGGIGQVLGRLGYGLLHRHTHTRSRTVAIVFAVAATTALLGLFTSTVALVAAVLAAGMARGLFTLLQATAVPDRWGAAHVGRLMGLLVAPLTVATALGPWVGVGLAEVTGGHPQAFLILAALAAAAVAAAAASAPRQPPKPEHPTH